VALKTRPGTGEAQRRPEAAENGPLCGLAKESRKKYCLRPQGRLTDRRSSFYGAPMSLLLPHEISKPPNLFKAFNHYKLLKKLLKSSAAAAAAG
jgi:hypothetical protein